MNISKLVPKCKVAVSTYDFFRKFPNQTTAQRHIEQRRWNSRPVCPHCGKWLYAVYLVVTASKGISSVQLSKELGVRQATAWFMLQRIGQVCSKDDGNEGGGFLSGIVEVDESYIGAKESNKHESKRLKAGRGAVGKLAVIGNKQRAGKLKAALLTSTSAKAIQAAVMWAVAPGATRCTHEHASYKGMMQHNHLSSGQTKAIARYTHLTGLMHFWAR